MGSHTMQAVALAVFLAGFSMIGAGLALEGNYALIGLGVLITLVSCGMFRRIKMSESASS